MNDKRPKPRMLPQDEVPSHGDVGVPIARRTLLIGAGSAAVAIGVGCGQGSGHGADDGSGGASSTGDGGSGGWGTTGSMGDPDGSSTEGSSTGDATDGDTEGDVPGCEATIDIPPFEHQVIDDPVPATNACWWDPTDGDDGNDGSSKALAKQTFGAAQEAIGAGGTVVVAGGRHTVPEVVFTKSGTARKRLKLFAEPGAEVVLYREGEFRGAAERTWTWTLVDRDKMIWESPDLGLPDGETIVNNIGGRGQVTHGLWGFMRCPKGADGEERSAGSVRERLAGSHRSARLQGRDRPERRRVYRRPAESMTPDGRFRSVADSSRHPEPRLLDETLPWRRD